MITSYECHGKGSELLKSNLQSVFAQTYRPLQCIVSDHSRDDVIQNMVKTLDHKDIDFIFVRYQDNYGNPCHNWNNALKYATGETLQYMCMDDTLVNPNSITDAINFMKDTNSKWICCDCLVKPRNYIHTARWNDKILYGLNGIGAPGAAIITSALKHIQFDPQFNWLMDCEWYYRLYKEVGRPRTFNRPVYTTLEHEYQLTNTVNSQTKRKLEHDNMLKKYGNPLPLCP
jgi:glycosyltransferase involved in cell wall biosynthesis